MQKGYVKKKPNKRCQNFSVAKEFNAIAIYIFKIEHMMPTQEGE